MNIFKLHAKQIVPISLDEAWDYFSNPMNLVKITPPELGLTLKEEVAQVIHSGMMIEYVVKPVLNIPLTWLTEIKHVQQPFLFVDEQRTGPYKLWYHMHYFRAVEGGVEIEDIVYYALPFGLLSSLINTLFISRKLETIFTFRKSILTNVFKGKNG